LVQTSFSKKDIESHPTRGKGGEREGFGGSWESALNWETMSRANGAALSKNQKKQKNKTREEKKTPPKNQNTHSIMKNRKNKSGGLEGPRGVFFSSRYKRRIQFFRGYT